VPYRSPYQLAFVWLFTQAPRKEDSVIQEKANCPRSASQAVERIEHQAKSGLHFSIGIEVEHPFGPIHQAHRRSNLQFAAPRLVDLAAAHSRAKNVQFCLAHCSLEPEQQSIIEARRIVDPVFVKNKRRGQRAELE
jgi:hypothetical protein